MKDIGIWIDKEKAHVISISENSEDMVTIFSDIEDYRIHGGSGTRLKGGPQDVVQDSKYLEREKHQFKKYFDSIIPRIEKADRIVIFGPAQTGSKLKKELKTNHIAIAKKVQEVRKADSMSENQTKALIREYFNSHRQN